MSVPMSHFNRKRKMIVKKSEKNQGKKKSKDMAYYFKAIPVVCFGIISLYIISVILDLESNSQLVEIIMAISMGLLGIVSVFLILFRKEKEQRYQVILCAVLLSGLILRAGYMIYTPCDVRRHDLWGFEMEAGGHAGYILTLFYEHRLPDSNFRQYYQQPLFYLLGSVLSFLITGITRMRTAYHIVDAAKTVSCIASSVSFLTVVPLCEELNIGKKGKLIALLISASLPSVIYASGMVCPDALTMMFFTITFYLTLRWYNKPSIAMTILLALAYGFAMQTKISCGLMAVFTAFVFLYALIGKKYAEQRKGLIINYIIFSGIAFPIGLWYGIRNLILFQQPFTYVLPLTVDGPLYRGDYSVWKRLFLIPLDNLFATPYGDTYSDYNLPLFLVKSSLFGEWEVGSALPRIYPYFILAVVILLSILTVVAAVFCVVHCVTHKDKKILFTAGIFFAMILSANAFYLQYPFGCSMDFRYYIFLVVPAGLLLAKASEYLKMKWAENVLLGICILSAVLNACFILRIQ